MIRFKEVSFSYGADEVDVLKNINFTIDKGEFVLLTGISGSGKTSMTKLINGLIPEFEQGDFRGNVFVNEQNTREIYVSDLSHRVGSVFQDPNTQFFTTDVLSELVFPCENVGLGKEEIDCRLEEIQKTIGIEHLLEKELFHLSGGEKQRVAIASVCMGNSKVIVLDEPSANLDGASIQKLKEVLIGLKQEGYTIVISEHRIHYLMELCDRVVHMNEGSIETIYQGEEFRRFSNEQLHAMGLRAGDLTRLQLETELELESKVEPEVESELESEPESEVQLESKGNDRIPQKENLTIKDIVYDYGNGHKVLNEVSMTLHQGDIVGIIGENGAGKTTLMEIICGLRREKTGSVYIKKKFAGLKVRKNRTYLVMQVPEYQLFTESVAQEIALSGTEVSVGRDLLKTLHLDEFLERHPASLSGGQKQRLCILLATLKDADIICFDEPTSGLDYRNMQEVLKVLQELASQGKTILVVTHDNKITT